jgi:hypothetical protein
MAAMGSRLLQHYSIFRGVILLWQALRGAPRFFEGEETILDSDMPLIEYRESSPIYARVIDEVKGRMKLMHSNYVRSCLETISNRPGRKPYQSERANAIA